MPVLLGADLGTTTVTALALDTDDGRILACHTAPNTAETTTPAAQATGLRPGVPVLLGIGDNQASFLGSVADRADTVLVNVGTGGQVVGFTGTFHPDPEIETRPFPHGGCLLVSAGLCGGGLCAVLERFFRPVGRDVLGTDREGPGAD